MLSRFVIRATHERGVGVLSADMKNCPLADTEVPVNGQ